MRLGQARQATQPPSASTIAAAAPTSSQPEQAGAAAEMERRQRVRLGVGSQRGRPERHVAANAGREARRDLDGRPFHRKRHDVAFARRVAHQAERQLDGTLGRAGHAGPVDTLDVVVEAKHGRAPQIAALGLDRADPPEGPEEDRRDDTGRVDSGRVDEELHLRDEAIAELVAGRRNGRLHHDRVGRRRGELRLWIVGRDHHESHDPSHRGQRSER